MDEKTETVRARRVTYALAELDLLFSLAKKEGAEDRLWDIGPFLPEPPVNVRLSFNGNWLVALSLEPLKEKPDSSLFLQLLELPLKMPLARVALSKISTSEDSGLVIMITSDIAEAKIDADSLKESIGAVVGCARMVQGLLKDEMPPKLTLAPPRPRRRLRNRLTPRR